MHRVDEFSPVGGGLNLAKTLTISWFREKCTFWGSEVEVNIVESVTGHPEWDLPDTRGISIVNVLLSLHCG